MPEYAILCNGSQLIVILMEFDLKECHFNV